MSVPAPWTAVRTTPNRHPRLPVGRIGAIAHHHAGTSFAGLRNAVMGGRSVSYTAIVDGSEAERIVPDAYRPWSVANARRDSLMRSVCLNNAALGPGWHVADDTVWTAAAAIAHWASHEGWWPHRDGDPRSWTVIGHREVRTIHAEGYATACPGGSPLDLLTHRAQQLLRPTPQEDNPVFPIIWHVTGGPTHIFLMGPGHIHHFETMEAATYVRNVVTTEDTFHHANNDELRDLQRALDIPWDAVVQVLNATAPGVDGKVWSRVTSLDYRLHATFEDAVYTAQHTRPTIHHLEPDIDDVSHDPNLSDLEHDGRGEP